MQNASITDFRSNYKNKKPIFAAKQTLHTKQSAIHIKCSACIGVISNGDAENFKQIVNIPRKRRSVLVRELWINDFILQFYQQLFTRIPLKALIEFQHRRYYKV